MGINNVMNSDSVYNSKSTANERIGQTKKPEKNSGADKHSDAAAVYEKSSENNSEMAAGTVYRRDDATIERLLAEADKRSQDLRELVEKMLLQQGHTFDATTDIYALLREGKVQVDPETRAQAQKDIAEDGYWGVKQTSDRLVSFAKALTGGDPSKADEMISAVKQGYEQAKKAWGGELPDICKETFDTAIRKLEAWRASASDDEAMESNAKASFTGQAAAVKQAK